MVSGRAWKPSVIMRFVLCNLSFCFCGSLLVTLLHHGPSGRAQDLLFYRLTASALGCTAASVAFVYRPWNPDQVIRRLIGYVCFFYAGLGLGMAAHKAGEIAGPSISKM